MAAASITALLGPTNTGKTHRAIERMLEHETGMIGLPLRLLAREVYDRVTTRVGEAAVALVTGEEKRVPRGARYFVCTVEAMPRDREVDFLAVDEIQLAGHRERGHVFTERLLSARGTQETWFLGADTMRGLIRELVPTAHQQGHPRLSRLSGSGSATLRALPPRSAVVAFSTARVYELAERIRHRRGGAAVVLGALSPRTRNAQVAMFQAGEVDYLVATDAIGMGLNLSLSHVAFADLRKFDGKETRPLEPAELAQIAGRAGRHLEDGTFGTLAPLPALPAGLVEAIETHRFAPVRQAIWRSSDVDTSGIDALIASLKKPAPRANLRLVERADDLDALIRLAERREIRARATSPDRVALLWTVCQIPDFRKLMLDHHANLVADVFTQLCDRGRLDPDWVTERIRRTDDVAGDIDTLLMRIESIRTWTYVTSHASWIDDSSGFQERARAVEDRLSDALHAALVERFVERARRGRSRELPPSGHPFDRLRELRDELDPGSSDAEPDDLVDAEHSRFFAAPDGCIRDGEKMIGVLVRGADLLRPEVRVTLEDAGSGDRSRVQRRLVAWSRDLVSELFGMLRGPELRELSAAARGLVYQLEQNLGSVRSRAAQREIEALTARDRELLHAAGVEIGEALVFVRELTSPEAVRVKSALLSAWFDVRLPALEGPSFSPPNMLSPELASALGYPLLGPLAVRVDVVERVARAHNVGLARIASWIGCSKEDAKGVIAVLGTRRRRKKRRARRPPGKHCPNLS